MKEDVPPRGVSSFFVCIQRDKPSGEDARFRLSGQRSFGVRLLIRNPKPSIRLLGWWKSWSV